MKRGVVRSSGFRLLAIGVLVFIAGLVLGCEQPSIPAAPSEPDFKGPYALAGRVTSTGDGAPVGGAVVSFIQYGRHALADDDGRFEMGNVPPSILFLETGAPGYLTHRTKLTVTGSRADLALNIIRESAPFELEFYRELARGQTEGPLDITRRWTVNPSFYIRTVTTDTRDPVEEWKIDAIERIFRNTVPELSGGRHQVAAIERGTAARLAQNGWVTVDFYRHPFDPRPGVLGRATYGGNLGTISILIDPDRERRAEDIFPSCGSSAVRVAEHEIVHTMGFRHTRNTFADFQTEECAGAERPERVRYHAAIMYSRPPGNVDIDNDPTSYFLPTTAAEALRIQCDDVLFYRGR